MAAWHREDAPADVAAAGGAAALGDDADAQAILHPMHGIAGVEVRESRAEGKCAPDAYGAVDAAVTKSAATRRAAEEQIGAAQTADSGVAATSVPAHARVSVNVVSEATAVEMRQAASGPKEQHEQMPRELPDGVRQEARLGIAPAVPCVHV